MHDPVSARTARRASVLFVGLLLLAVALRGLSAFNLLGRVPLVSDAESFASEAVDWLAHGHPHPFYWPPGNTVLLVLFFRALGDAALAARLAMVLVSSLTVLFAALIARRLGGRRAMLATAALGALYMPAVLLCSQSYSQHLAGLCLVCVAYFGPLALRDDRALAYPPCGFFFGLGCLTRPSMLGIAPVLLVLALISLRAPWRARDLAHLRRIAVGLACAATCAAATLAPAVAHNHARGAGFTISTNNERNLFLGNNRFTPDYKTGHLGQRSVEELPADVRVYLLGFYERPDARKAMQREAVDYMRGHPLRTLYRIANRARAFWGFDYLATRVVQQHAQGRLKQAAPVLLALEAGTFVATMALAACAIVALRASMRRGFGLWLGALVLAYQIPYLIAFSAGTYHFPVMGLVWPFAGVAVAHVSREGLRPFAQRLGARGFAVLALLLAVQVEYAVQTAGMSSP